MPHPVPCRGPSRPRSTFSNSNGFGPTPSEPLERVQDRLDHKRWWNYQDAKRRLRDTADEPFSPSSCSAGIYSERLNSLRLGSSDDKDGNELQSELRKILEDFEVTLLNFMQTRNRPSQFSGGHREDDVEQGIHTHNTHSLIDVNEADMIKMRSNRASKSDGKIVGEDSGPWAASGTDQSGPWARSGSPQHSADANKIADSAVVNSITTSNSRGSSRRNNGRQLAEPEQIMRKCFKNWRRYINKCREAGGRSSHSIGSVTIDTGTYPLLPLWKRMLTEKNDSAVTSLRSKRRFSTVSISSGITNQEIKGSTHSGWSNFSKLAANPLSYKRIFWEILGVCLITYDVVAIPLQVFEEKFGRSGQRIPMVFTAAYWTTDIPYSFFTGFFDEGRLEMRSKKLAAKYIKTWFFPDVFLVGMDWVLIAFEFQQDDRLQGAEFIKYGRALRFLRLLRLLRIFKLTSFFNKFTEQINSEHVLTLMRISRLVILIVLANHFVACAFYAVGSTEIWDPDRRMWTKKTFKDSDDVAYRYFTSLHWSLTQFMPASMEVVPTQTWERLFNVLVVISAMIVFSSFVSSITEAMTHLRSLDKKRNEVIQAVRIYFSENAISMELSARVWRYLNHIARHRRRRKKWDEIAPLRELPDNLQIELKCEIFRPVMISHPFFYHYQDTSPAAMRAICQKAAFEISLTHGQDLFAAGDAAHSMYFVSAGMLEYTIRHEDSGNLFHNVVRKDQWAAEAAVWLHWFHVGTMTTKQDCLMIALNATTLHECLEKYDDTLFVAARYAWFFFEMMNSPGELTTDLCINFDNLQHMTQKAFSHDDSFEIDGTGSVNSRFSGFSASSAQRGWGVAYSWADVIYRSRTGDLQKRLALTAMLKRWRLM